MTTPIFPKTKENFPFVLSSVDELLEKFRKLKRLAAESSERLGRRKSFHIPRLLAGLRCSNHFFQVERMQTRTQGRRQNCIDFWVSNHPSIDAWCLKHAGGQENTFNRNRYYYSVCFLNHPPGQFSPGVATRLFKLLSARKVFDPYAGWGDRLLAAMACDIDYVGVDSNTNLKPAYAELIEFFQRESNSKVKMMFRKSESLLSPKQIDKFKAYADDVIFSSPPFWSQSGRTAIESYFKCEDDYETFMRESLIPVTLNCIRTARYTCLYIPKHMYEHLIERSKGAIPRAQHFIYFGSRKRLKTPKAAADKKLIYCWAHQTRTD